MNKTIGKHLLRKNVNFKCAQIKPKTKTIYCVLHYWHPPIQYAGSQKMVSSSVLYICTLFSQLGPASAGLDTLFILAENRE